MECGWGVVIGDRGAIVDISPKLVLPIILRLCMLSAVRCALCVAEGHLCSEVLLKAICHQGNALRQTMHVGIHVGHAYQFGLQHTCFAIRKDEYDDVYEEGVELGGRATLNDMDLLRFRVD
jgi:hypothetical protein